MNARRLTLGAGLMVGAALLVPWRPESPLPGSTVAAPSRTDERVRIEHELVRIPVTARPAVKSTRLTQPVPIPAPNVQRTRVEGQPLRASNPAPEPERGLVGKAVQRIVGNGRYRPEPFPRVK